MTQRGYMAVEISFPTIRIFSCWLLSTILPARGENGQRLDDSNPICDHQFGTTATVGGGFLLPLLLAAGALWLTSLREERKLKTLTLSDKNT
ncbi:hypothetical protein FVEG_14805 [Fusarium verticillioides 7600]|nr:hypothetical protein FVEG_14805 [Fusarium verticillioides 7600]EWG37868.1 hypothetical protein FVEG_14805 [Fusarium verticillioides 7600]